MYKTVVLDYAPRADTMAAAVEREANEQERQGFSLVTLSLTGSAKAILVFRRDEPKADDHD